MPPDHRAASDRHAAFLVLLAVAVLLTVLAVGYDTWRDGRSDSAALLDSD